MHDSGAAAKVASAAGTYLLVVPWNLEAIGGVSQAVSSLYDGIRKDGRLIPRVLVLSWGALTPTEDIDVLGRAVVRLRVRSPMGNGSFLGGFARYLLFLPLELGRIRALVRRYAIEVINCHYIGTSEITWAIAKTLGIFRGKVILSLHGLDIRNLARLRGIRRMLWRWALRRADAIVTCSDGLAIETMNEFRLPRTQVVTIHNGVDPARLARVTGSPDPVPFQSTVGPTLLNLGTLEHKKGHDLLLKAFKRVAERYPTAHLTIMGRSAETSESTVRMVEELELTDRVSIRLNAPHDLALRALTNTDIFVLSSRNEAFSVALLEAGALGKPIVATDVCGVPELIQNGVTGILVPTEDVDALAKGILTMLDNRALATECGRRLKEVVSNKFTVEETCRNYLRLMGYT